MRALTNVSRDNLSLCVSLLFSTLSALCFSAAAAAAAAASDTAADNLDLRQTARDRLNPCSDNIDSIQRSPFSLRLVVSLPPFDFLPRICASETPFLFLLSVSLLVLLELYRLGDQSVSW